ncbi:ubiquitin-like protein 7 [Drosophila takahashii]|uniref:ubiquitin-like protein 7 n=1 Tax=Drosophila takahashii TaxID=29030 RepID=UPI0038994E36
MHTLYALLKNKLSDVHPLHNIDLERDVAYLKAVVTKEMQLQIDASELEIIHHGRVLEDADTLSRTGLQPNAVIHCFRKVKRYTPYVPPAATEINTKHIQELFSLTSHLQISVTSRFNILQKILAEYPEFRRNLGAQALIRDSVLFNMLHEPEVVQNLVKDYPLICEAAPFIVDTIRKELARNSSATQFQEQAASESTTSSEEENSLGAGSSSSGGSSSTAVAAAAAASRRDEMANIRQISRQQLANALANVTSFNSLSSIAQRNADEALQGDERPRTTSAPIAGGSAGTVTVAASSSGGASGSSGYISSDLFRNELARAFQSLAQQQPPPVENMEVESGGAPVPEPVAPVAPADDVDDEDDGGDDSDVLPRCYRRHRFTEQLRTMAAMGFINHTQNVSYLEISDGNVEHAINLLMLGMN